MYLGLCVSTNLTGLAIPDTCSLLGACSFEPHWHAVQTHSRHEKVVREHLLRREIECFLPTYETVRRWQNGRARLELPLFPGYLFARISREQRLRVLQLPSVARLVSFNGQPARLPDSDIEALRVGLRTLTAEPHPYLKIGKRVRIRRGPLEGLEGILVRKKCLARVVLSLDLIMRSVAVEIDVADVQPIS